MAVRQFHRRRRWLLGAVLLLILLVATISPLVALADGGGGTPGPDSMVPGSPLPTDPAKLPLYERFPIGHYSMNGDYGWTNPGYAIANAFLSGLFMVSAFLAKWVVRGLQFAFTLSIFDPLSPVVDEVMLSLRDSIWLPFLTTAILIVAGWAVWKGMLQRQYSEVWGTLLTSALLILAAVWTFEHMGTTLAKLNDYSSLVSGRVLTAGSSWDKSTGVQPGDSTETALNKTVTAAGESMWSHFVVYPWAVANFGTIPTAEKEAYALPGVPGGKFLAANSDDRKQRYDDNGGDKNPDFAMWQPTSDALGSRFVIVLMTLLSTLVYGVLMLLLAGAVLFFQMLALFWAFGAPVVFLLGLIPGWGARLVERWALRLLGFLVMKVGIALVFAGVMVIGSGIYKVANQIPGGWVLGLVLQVILVVGLYFYRAKLTDMFSALGTGAMSRARSLLEHGSEEHQATRTIRQAPILAATGAKQALAKAREVYEQRQARAWAVQRLDQRTKTDKAFREQVQTRTRQGLHRYTEEEIQGQIRLYGQIKAEGQDPQRALLKPVEAGTQQEYLETQSDFDKEMAQYRQMLEEREREYRQRAGVATRQKSFLGRLLNRRKGAAGTPAAGQPPAGPPAGPAPHNPPPGGGAGVVVPFQRPARPVPQRTTAQQVQIPKAIRSPSSANRDRPYPHRPVAVPTAAPHPDGEELHGSSTGPVLAAGMPAPVALDPGTTRSGPVALELETAPGAIIRGAAAPQPVPQVSPRPGRPADPGRRSLAHTREPAEPHQPRPVFSRAVTRPGPPAVEIHQERPAPQVRQELPAQRMPQRRDEPAARPAPQVPPPQRPARVVNRVESVTGTVMQRLRLNDQVRRALQVRARLARQGDAGQRDRQGTGR